MLNLKPVIVLDDSGYERAPITTPQCVRTSDGNGIGKFLSNPNLFDNSNFLNPVNQRGLPSVTKYGYFIDRWEIEYSNPVVAKIDTMGLTITAGSEPVTLRQTIDNTNIQNEYTLSICTSTDEVYSVTGIPNIEKIFTVPFGNMRISANNGRVNVMFVVMASKTMSLKWAKLEEGSVATQYIPKSYSEELLECMRYFQWHFRGCHFYLPYVGGSQWYANLQYPVEMRINPTLSCTNPAGTFVLESSQTTKFGAKLCGGSSAASNYQCIIQDIKLSADL